MIQIVKHGFLAVLLIVHLMVVKQKLVIIMEQILLLLMILIVMHGYQLVQIYRQLDVKIELVQILIYQYFQQLIVIIG